MAFGKFKKEEAKTEETKIWVCQSDDCNCWVRDNFKSEETPQCPICKSSMEPTTKVLEVVENKNSNW